MAQDVTADNRSAGTLAKAAVALGVLAVIAFFVLGFFVGDWWFVVAFVIGAAAVIAGWVARKRAPVDPSEPRLATIGLILGAVPVVWFLVYMIVTAIF